MFAAGWTHFPELTVTKPRSSPRAARPCLASARRPMPILSSRSPEDPAEPAHRAATPRRRANEYLGAAPNAGQDPFRHASPPHPTTSKSSRRKIPQRHGLRKSRRLAKTSSGLLGPQPPRATENLGASNETLLELTICRSRPDVARCPQVQVGRPNVESVQLRGRLSTPSNNEGRSRPRPLQRLVRSRKDLPRGPWRLAPLRTRELQASTQPPPRRR